jgi:hypothetical protein
VISTLHLLLSNMLHLLESTSTPIILWYVNLYMLKTQVYTVPVRLPKILHMHLSRDRSMDSPSYQLCSVLQQTRHTGHPIYVLMRQRIYPNGQASCWPSLRLAAAQTPLQPSAHKHPTPWLSPWLIGVPGGQRGHAGTPRPVRPRWHWNSSCR